MFLHNINDVTFDQIVFLGMVELLDFVHFACRQELLKHCKIGNPSERARMDVNLVGDLGNIEHISYVQLHRYCTHCHCAVRRRSCR